MRKQLVFAVSLCPLDVKYCVCIVEEPRSVHYHNAQIRISFDGDVLLNESPSLILCQKT